MESKGSATFIKEHRKGKKKIDDEVLLNFDMTSTFKIQIDDHNYYVLKDYKDGNYLSIDDKGSVYTMIHDPYKIEQIFSDKDSFLKSVMEGKYNIETL